VLLARGPGSPEVFVVGRAPGLRFMGGFHAFPGGKVHPTDADLTGWAPGLSAQHVAATRELFEEAGVLLARRPDGAFPATGPELAESRRQLLAGAVPFGDLLARLGLALRPDDLTPAGALVTPDFAPVRFDTAFFVADLPPGQEAEVWPGELTDGAWHSADEALRRWTRGEVLLSPPTVSLLRAVQGRPVAELAWRFGGLVEALAGGAIPPIWFSPAVQMIPLHTDGLPPSTHTSAWLVGTGPAYLIDPGPSDPDEQARLFELLDARRDGAALPSAVVLTHHHPDHVGAAAACARRYGIPVLAHALTARALEGKVEVQRELSDGERLDLGPAPDGAGRWHLEAVHTPGHARGHLAFVEPRYGLLFAGDMVSTLSSVLIAPSEGDLAVYLDSLRRLQTYPLRLLLPAHGPPSARPAFILEQCMAHRAQREAELVEELTGPPRTVAELAVAVYRGLPAKLMKYAEMQVAAGLQKLEREGRAEAVATAAGPAWRGRPAG
jgi:glyoxylase-like metal-dependent hydrolase (beta-lactamase superfamily II)/8-oxo-dGTP pyrophosphatase MutT (NUDIX family)